jgi:hypothetical protein
MSEKNISKIIPVMPAFFTMGFIDLTGISRSDSHIAWKKLRSEHV